MIVAGEDDEIVEGVSEQSMISSHPPIQASVSLSMSPKALLVPMSSVEEGEGDEEDEEPEEEEVSQAANVNEKAEEDEEEEDQELQQIESNALQSHSHELSDASPALSASSSQTQPIDPVELMSRGFFNNIHPVLSNLTARLEEIRTSQQGLFNALCSEGKSLQQLPFLSPLQDIFFRVPEYELRIKGVKKEMDVLSERVKYLRRRAERAASKKLDEDEEERKKRENERRKDEALLAKPIDGQTAQPKMIQKLAVSERREGLLEKQ